jgi:hypothetical protein
MLIKMLNIALILINLQLLFVIFAVYKLLWLYIAAISSNISKYITGKFSCAEYEILNENHQIRFAYII